MWACMLEIVYNEFSILGVAGQKKWNYKFGLSFLENISYYGKRVVLWNLI